VFADNTAMLTAQWPDSDATQPTDIQLKDLLLSGTLEMLVASTFAQLFSQEEPSVLTNQETLLLADFTTLKLH
jgi:hypothetical protein